MFRSQSAYNLNEGAWGRKFRGNRRGRGFFQQGSRGRGYWRGGGGFRRGRGGRRGGRNDRGPPPTREDLDKELDDYMKDSRGALDKDIDQYMSEKQS